MAQHDYVIANDTAANVRADINNALAAVVSNNSGATAPATTYANEWWYDTATDTLKIRAEANDAWISVALLNQTTDQSFPIVGGVTVTSTGTELNLVDGSVAGTIVNSKAVVYGAAGQVNATTLQIAGTSITSTAAELNILDGVTATAAEINYLDITTLGTSQASKAVTAGADGAVKFSNAIMETVYTLAGTDIDPVNGTIQVKTLAANTTFTEALAAGESVIVMIDDGTAFTVTWPTTTWVNNGKVAPTLATTGYTVVALWKVSTTLYGALVGNGF